MWFRCRISCQRSGRKRDARRVLRDVLSHTVPVENLEGSETLQQGMRRSASPLAECYILPSDCVLLCIHFHTTTTSETPYVAIDERGLVRSIHLFLFSCVH